MKQDDYFNDFEEFPIAYSIDNMILMHRDAHFGGHFSTMLEYYKNNEGHIHQDIEIERIEELAKIQESTGSDLAPLMLSGAEAEKVAEALKAYRELRELCENKNKKTTPSSLIAELILSEKLELPSVIEAVVAEKTKIVQPLIDLMKSEEFHDPLFPGYGEAPILAAKCLGMIGDKRAIISLFEAIGREDFFNESLIFDALKTIGEPAKSFLLKVLQSNPITCDNEQAALALISFKEDLEVSSKALKYLLEIDLNKYTPLATSLVLICESLKLKSEQELFKNLAKRDALPKILRQDILAISQEFKVS